MTTTSDEKLKAVYYYHHDKDFEGYVQVSNDEAEFPITYTKEMMIGWLKDNKHQNAIQITITEIWYCKRTAPDIMKTQYTTVISKEYDVMEEMRMRVNQRNGENK